MVRETIEATESHRQHQRRRIWAGDPIRNESDPIRQALLSPFGAATLRQQPSLPVATPTT